MRLDLREPLTALVKAKFTTAKNSGALIFSATELAIIRAAGVSYQLRYCPALSKKPAWEQSSTGATSAPPKIDPFHNPPTELLIAEIPSSRPSHLLVLNKYPVIPNHFILATKEYREQTKLLEQDDLAATMSCLREWEEESQERLFAFFNSGRHSGASQPHRHIQFLPVGDMNWGGAEGWKLPLEGENTRPSIGFPFVHLTAPLSSNIAPGDVHAVYMGLYKRAVSVVEVYNARHPRDTVDIDGRGNDWAEISYNLAMTTSMMVLCPRRTEDAFIRVDDDEKEGKKELGPVSLNGTILGGTLMVKTEEEWNALRGEASKLKGMLETVGFPVEEVVQSHDSRL
ncbi:MAG: hypothetical protein M1823_002028 [Watsoniomyces obsoletus]|nr:MAG: hypothetical protein M1823_002028 [Watsoniomyces obsoletus]